MSSLSFTETTFISPVFQIGRRVELHFLSHSKNHNPFVSSIMPEYFRIAKVSLCRSQNRITRILFESLSIIKAISHALHLAFACRSIESDDGSGTETSRIILIYYARTAEDSTECIGGDSYRLMFPGNEVGAGGMSPAQVSPE